MTHQIKVEVDGAPAEVKDWEIKPVRLTDRPHEYEVQFLVRGSFIPQPSRYIHPGPYRRVGEPRSAESIHD